ncbi:MAG: radical SAM protein, partial [Candidatus Woesearchaeota archaeon]
MDWKQKNPIKINSFHLQWHITERCNLSCKHCYQDENFIKDELGLDKLKIILDKYIKFLKLFNLNNNRISITGGEPFIRKDIFDLIKIINSKNIKYGILT